MRVSLSFTPVAVICPTCGDELGLMRPDYQACCPRCRKVWRITLPTVPADEVPFDPEADSLEPA
jgi:predicted amidophosphoribosyltransferase